MASSSSGPLGKARRVLDSLGLQGSLAFRKAFDRLALDAPPAALGDFDQNDRTRGNGQARALGQLQRAQLGEEACEAPDRALLAYAPRPRPPSPPPASPQPARTQCEQAGPGDSLAGLQGGVQRALQEQADRSAGLAGLEAGLQCLRREHVALAARLDQADRQGWAAAAAARGQAERLLALEALEQGLVQGEGETQWQLDVVAVQLRGAEQEAVELRKRLNQAMWEASWLSEASERAAAALKENAARQMRWLARRAVRDELRGRLGSWRELAAHELTAQLMSLIAAQTEPPPSMPEPFEIWQPSQSEASVQASDREKVGALRQLRHVLWRIVQQRLAAVVRGWREQAAQPLAGEIVHVMTDAIATMDARSKTGALQQQGRVLWRRAQRELVARLLLWQERARRTLKIAGSEYKIYSSREDALLRQYMKSYALFK